MEDALVLSGDFRKTRLDNGLRIVTEQIPFVQSVSLGIWVKAGSRNEEKKEHGISHFLEHMLFKGTEKRDAFEIVNSLESLGGELDAFTSRDHTCFYARCLAEHVDVALDVLIDMLQNPKLDLEDIEKEKRVILEEIHAVEDTPEELVHDLFSESVWSGHPVGGPDHSLRPGHALTSCTMSFALHLPLCGSDAWSAARSIVFRERQGTRHLPVPAHQHRNASFSCARCLGRAWS